MTTGALLVMTCTPRHERYAVAHIEQNTVATRVNASVVNTLLTAEGTSYVGRQGEG